VVARIVDKRIVRFRWGILVLVSAAAVSVGLAVKYGAASEDETAVAHRCTRVMLDEYETGNDPRKATMGPKAFALVAPKVCSLGVARGVVRDDGTMSRQAGYDLAQAVVHQMGAARFQTLIFNELATGRYHLAEPGRATRWHRCVAMGYSAWDGQPSGAQRPPRNLYRRAVREACTVGIRRGIVPPSGAPVTNSAAGAAMQQLLMSTVLRHSLSQG
jgi:hypothetical protein